MSAIEQTHCDVSPYHANAFDLCTPGRISVESPSVQNALDKLREQNYLWRSQRGSYAVEDEQFLEWLNLPLSSLD